jgi:hypothetical protein
MSPAAIRRGWQAGLAGRRAQGQLDGGDRRDAERRAGRGVDRAGRGVLEHAGAAADLAERLVGHGADRGLAAHHDQAGLASRVAALEPSGRVRA